MSTATIVGIGLGWWCGRLAGGAGSSWRVAGRSLSERAFPWVGVAFLLGVGAAWTVVQVVPARALRDADERRTVAATTLLLAAAAASLALVVATLVYYRDLPLTARRTVGWAGISVIVGAGFGSAGAVWAIWRRSLAGTLAVITLAATVAGEAAMVLARGADRYAAAARLVTLVELALAVVVVAVMPKRQRGAAVVAVVVLAVPGAWLIGTVLSYTGNV